MTMRRTKTGKDTSPPNPLAKGRKLPIIEGTDRVKLGEFHDLLARRGFEKTAQILKKSPENVIFIAKILLNGVDNRVRGYAGLALARAAKRGTDMTAAIPRLVKALEDKHVNIRAIAAVDLEYAARQGSDITLAIPALVKTLGDKDEKVRVAVVKALGCTARQDQKTLTLIVNEIIRFMRSDWFQNEMEKNSVVYERTANEIAQLLDKMREAEKKAA